MIRSDVEISYQLPENEGPAIIVFPVSFHLWSLRNMVVMLYRLDKDLTH